MATPITKVGFKYNIGTASRDHAVQLELIQFPLKLAWGATGHKFQGATVPKPDCMVAHLDTIFGNALTYVILGRICGIEQLFLSAPIDATMIKVDEMAAKEAQFTGSGKKAS